MSDQPWAALIELELRYLLTVCYKNGSDANNFIEAD